MSVIRLVQACTNLRGACLFFGAAIKFDIFLGLDFKKVFHKRDALAHLSKVANRDGCLQHSVSSTCRIVNSQFLQRLVFAKFQNMWNSKFKIFLAKSVSGYFSIGICLSSSAGHHKYKL